MILLNINKKQKVQSKNEIIKKINIYKSLYIYKSLNRPFNLKENYDSIIPLKIFTCWHTKDLPPLMKDNYQKIINIHSNFEHFLYDEKECESFIRDIL